MNVIIYLGTANGKRVDATNIESGNPGVGGTQYCMLELAHYLNKCTDYKVIIVAYREYLLEDGIEYLKLDDNNSLSHLVDIVHADILIMSHFRNRKLEDEIASINCKVIIWSHNYIYSDFCDYISRTNSIKANVFVGKQQYDRYIDDNVILKSTYIYNMFHDNTSNVVRNNDNNTIVYMGALVESKGFAELCSIWPSILKINPNAKLKVLGSGSLYGDVKLGKYGIAVDSYERKFIKYITDSNGSILPSVEFLGIIGSGKTDIFRNASVGVVNPTAKTETFCMGVVEMAEAMLPIVTIGKNGFFDTVENGVTGYLENTLKGVKNRIVELLSNNDKNQQMGVMAKERIAKFSPEKIGPLWVDLITCVYNDCYTPVCLNISKPVNNNYKWLRVISRFFRFSLKLKFLPSIIKLESLIVKLLHVIKR